MELVVFHVWYHAWSLLVHQCRLSPHQQSNAHRSLNQVRQITTTKMHWANFHYFFFPNNPDASSAKIISTRAIGGAGVAKELNIIMRYIAKRPAPYVLMYAYNMLIDCFFLCKTSSMKAANWTQLHKHLNIFGQVITPDQMLGTLVGNSIATNCNNNNTNNSDDNNSITVADLTSKRAVTYLSTWLG